MIVASGTRALTPAGRAPETIIVGAGIAGLACARRLDEVQHPYLMITENVGGRIRRSGDGAVNLGAYYVRADYRHVAQLVERGRRINSLAVRRHDQAGSYTLWNHRLLLHLPQAARFLRQLRTFRSHYEALKANSVVMSQARAIHSDPYLWHLYRQPAPDFIRQHRIDTIARHYLAPGLHGTTFQPLSRLTAFVLLLGALPVIVPIYEFSLRSEILRRGWSRNLLEDTVAGIAPLGNSYRVDTQRNGTFLADHIVMATPAGASKRLLGLPEVKDPVRIHMFQIAGTLHRPWRNADIHLFADDNPVCVIARQADGSVLVCSHTQTPAFDHYFSTWEVIEHTYWNPAFNLVGDTLLECEQAPGLYLIGDHNVCGLEDAYITGLYAANSIAESTRARIGAERRIDDLGGGQHRHLIGCDPAFE